jgi:hypothetical protein
MAMIKLSCKIKLNLMGTSNHKFLVDSLMGINIAHKTLTKSSTFVEFVIKIVSIENLANIFSKPLNN